MVSRTPLLETDTEIVINEFAYPGRSAQFSIVANLLGQNDFATGKRHGSCQAWAS